ncbi:hypothetical protein Dimus_014928 [Dionaea muscipula]
MKKRVLMEQEEEVVPLIPYLAAELWISILARLPVKTLLKFRCVCKLWRDIIESSQFQVLHLSLYKSNWNTSSPMLSHMRSSTGPIVSQWTVIRGDTLESVVDIPSLPAATGSYIVEGYLDGLVLLSPIFLSPVGWACWNGSRPTSFLRSILWNPSIRKHVVIPPTYSEILSKSKSVARYGLGYDEVNNDYKVLAVNLPRLPCGGDGDGDGDGPAMVYSAVRKGGYVWKTLPACSLAPSPSDLVLGMMQYFKGKIYWIAISDPGSWMSGEGNRTEYCKLRSFDVCGESFHHTALPPTNGGCRLVHYGRNPMSLHILDGSIALLDVYRDQNVWIWVMEDQPAAGKKNDDDDTRSSSSSTCWVKRWSLSLQLHVCKHSFVHFLKKNGEEILFSTRGGDILKSYDIPKQRITAKALEESIFVSRVVGYVENLVLLKAAGQKAAQL